MAEAAEPARRAETGTDGPSNDDGPTIRLHPSNPLRPDYPLRQARQVPEATGNNPGPRRVYIVPPGSAPPFAIKPKSFLVGLTVYAMGFALAFALSWNTNSNWGRGMFTKLSYGLGAGLHSWSYLLLWLMYIWGRHNPAGFVSKLTEVAPPVVA